MDYYEKEINEVNEKIKNKNEKSNNEEEDEEEEENSENLDDIKLRKNLFYFIDESIELISSEKKKEILDFLMKVSDKEVDDKILAGPCGRHGFADHGSFLNGDAPGGLGALSEQRQRSLARLAQRPSKTVPAPKMRFGTVHLNCTVEHRVRVPQDMRGPGCRKNAAFNMHPAHVERGARFYAHVLDLERSARRHLHGPVGDVEIAVYERHRNRQRADTRLDEINRAAEMGRREATVATAGAECEPGRHGGGLCPADAPLPPHRPTHGREL